tara:strand:+ start:259 stop:387 length:129 start_codon:yes stop_codon:yes gene_type:complete
MSEEEYEIFFAGCDWGKTFDLFPKPERKIIYDPEFKELTNND